MKTIIKLVCIFFFLGMLIPGCYPGQMEDILNDLDTTQYKMNSVNEFKFEDFDEEFDFDESKNEQNHDQDLTPTEF